MSERDILYFFISFFASFSDLFLLDIVHPVVGPPFRYRGCTGRRRSNEAVFMKKVDMWP